MQRADIWGRTIEMQGSPWTLVVYHDAFGGDLLSDYIAACKKDPLELVDFLKVAWAMCRTHSDDAGDFEEWCFSFPAFTVDEGEGAAFVSVVDSAVMAELFRRRETRRARWRRKLRARWLGRASRRRRARQDGLLPR